MFSDLQYMKLKESLKNSVLASLLGYRSSNLSIILDTVASISLDTIGLFNGIQVFGLGLSENVQKNI